MKYQKNANRIVQISRSYISLTEIERAYFSKYELNELPFSIQWKILDLKRTIKTMSYSSERVVCENYLLTDISEIKKYLSKKKEYRSSIYSPIDCLLPCIAGRLKAIEYIDTNK
jgi:hypothetical protein